MFHSVLMVGRHFIGRQIDLHWSVLTGKSSAREKVHVIGGPIAFK